MTETRRANVAVALVLVAAGALSAAWALLVPIFQAPDEPAHFDYAMSIYGAGRLINLSDGRTDWIVSPYTKYLMQAADFERIAWHTSMRAPAGYGTRAYFARIDASAPSVSGATAPAGRISYIAPLYPFGFYALQALWMHLVSTVSNSIVTMFFAARLLCVAFFILGLFFNYRTALNLGLPAWTSVTLTAAIGFFPLATFVSSYVQPDNLVYALVSACLFFASCVRREEFPVRTIAALGISLGLLAVTKYQFFLSMALPLGLLLAVRYSQSRRSIARTTAVAAFVAPTVVLLALQYFFVSHAGGRDHGVPTDMNLSYLHSIVTLGWANAIGYVAVTALAGFANCFVTGGCAASFWQTIGWVDTPIVIVNANVELAIRVLIALLGISVAVVLGYSLFRNASRLLPPAVHGHFRSVVAIVAGDPVLNSYLCFGAIMIALFVVTENAFGMEGRQWYPYLFPAFLCFVWYAPRALNKRHLGTSAILCGGLLAYSVVASAYAMADLRERYYGPQVAHYMVTDPTGLQVSSNKDGALWPVISAEYHVSSRAFDFAFPRGARLLVDGSALMPDLNVVPSTVAVMIDGRTPLPVLSNQFLYPVAEITHNLNDGYSGFYANIPTEHLSEGPHTVSAFAQIPNSRRFDVIAPNRLFFITESGTAFSPAFVKSLQSASTVPGSLENAGWCPAANALLAGKVGGRPPNAYAGAWLLVNGAPYPARFDALTGTFSGTVPTQNLPPGNHTVAAFVIPSGTNRSLRIDAQATLTTYSERRSGESSLPACSDSLAQLEVR